MGRYDRLIANEQDLATWSPHVVQDAPEQPERKRKKRKPSAPVVVNGVLEAVDDPHRLARLFRHVNYRLPSGETTLVSYRGEFLEWRHNAWRPVELSELKSNLAAFTKAEFDRQNIEAQQKTGPDEPAPKCHKVTRTVVENTVLALASLAVVPATTTVPAWLASVEGDFPAAELLATATQLVHLPTAETGEGVIPGCPRFFTHTALTFDFDPNAGCPNWLALMESIWPTDPQSIATLQHFFGYSLLDDCRLQKMLMLIGPPRSGKGTIARVLRMLLGTANIAAPTLGSLADQFGLASLVGKRLAIVADARLSGRADATAVVERLLSITGEDPQDVQRKHQTTLAAIRLPVKFCILANELPNLRDSAGALLSRTVLLRMTRSFAGREDRGLEQRLMGELPGILNWAIMGLRSLQVQGEFLQPDSARELLDDLEDLASPIGQFIREVCIIGPEWTVPVADLYRDWCEWCKEHGRDHPGTEQAFGRDMRAAVPQLDTRRLGSDGSRTRWYQGLGRKPFAWDDDSRPHTSADGVIARGAQKQSD